MHRSYPAEISTSGGPLNPVRPPLRMEFPQELSLTCPELKFTAMPAVYETIPPLTHLPTVPDVPAEEAAS